MFKWVSYIEGISFLLLLFIAMPLKYFADMPNMVTIVGMAHGILFVSYMLFVATFFFNKTWTFKTALLATIASILPFGPFILDKKWLSHAEPPAC
ncbi:DUF3817 domain-containing protein [Bacillus sp. FSL W7-1360]